MHNIKNIVQWLGGSIVEHCDGGYEINLSPRLRMRLKRSTGIVFPAVTRVSEQDIITGTPLTIAITNQYNNEIGA